MNRDYREKVTEGLGRARDYLRKDWDETVERFSQYGKSWKTPGSLGQLLMWTGLGCAGYGVMEMHPVFFSGIPLEVGAVAFFKAQIGRMDEAEQQADEGLKRMGYTIRKCDQ